MMKLNWVAVSFVVLLILFVSFVILLTIVALNRQAEKTRLIEDCQKEMAFYECLYLWRSSANRDKEGEVLLVPVPTFK